VLKTQIFVIRLAQL